jgi:hypothetical protein
LIGRADVELFFPVILDLFERVEDGGDGFLFLASPFFHFSLRENRHKWLQMKSSHLPRRETQSSRRIDARTCRRQAD